VGFNPLVQNHQEKNSRPKKANKDFSPLVRSSLQPWASAQGGKNISYFLSLNFFFAEKTNGSKTIKKNNKHPSTTAKKNPLA